MYQKIKAKFKANPTIFYACSIVASWAGVGSLMNFRTVPCYREFGIDIANILDRPENVAQPMLCAAIKEAIERFEPRATYMGTTFKEAPDTPGRMLPVVEVSISA